MPQILSSTQHVAFVTAYFRYNATERPSVPPVPVIKGYDNVDKYLNEAIQLDEALLDLGSQLDRQTFIAPWPPLPEMLFAELDQWVRTCGLYDIDHCRWRDIHSGLPLEYLVGLYRRIIDEFHKTFCKSCPWTAGIACSTASFAPPVGRHTFKSMPSLIICGTRTTFDFSGVVDFGAVDSGLLFHAGPIEVMYEKDVVESHENLQLAAYARRILIQQPHRHTVRCLLLTENHVRMYVFDSNGLLYLDALNVHERPVEFLRSILHVSWCGASKDLDFNMTYNNGKLCIPAPSLHPDPLEVVDNVPLYRSEDLFGRRTVCWKLRTTDGGTAIIKNSSVYFDPTANMWLEYFFLDLAKGIPGVGRMYSHNERRIYRCIDRRWTPRNLADPVFPMQYNMRCSLVMQYYERSILDFDDRMELLCVLRDAISTHRRLWMKGIWQDDVRPENIRIPPPGSENGSRAVLIGFARAKVVNPMAGSEVDFNWDHAGRDKDTFKSRYRPMRIAPWLGYLHDLESFLLVPASICSTFVHPHLPCLPYDDLRKPYVGWDAPDYLYSGYLKDAFLLHQVHQVNDDVHVGKGIGKGRGDGNGNGGCSMVTDYFGRAFGDLITAWTLWLDAAFLEAVCQGRQKIMQTERHYNNVLEMIDTAIWRLEVVEEEKPVFAAPDAVHVKTIQVKLEPDC